MNANRPLKWRPTAKLDIEVPNELIQSLRALQELGVQKQRATELDAGKVVDGKAKVMPWED